MVILKNLVLKANLRANSYLTPFNFFDIIISPRFTIAALLYSVRVKTLPKPMTKELIFMIEHFPSLRMKIIELYNQDQDFRQICNDYCLSVNMLEAFRKTEPEIMKV